MPIYVSEPKTDFRPAPEGIHQAVCCDVVDKGIVTGKFGPIDTVQIRWQLEVCDEETGKPMMAVRSYKKSLHPESSLSKHLVSWRGRKFTAEEKARFDVEKLIGVNCQLQVMHTEREGKVYANVEGVLPVRKEMKPLKVTPDYVRQKDRDITVSNGHNVEHVDDSDIPF